MPAKNIYLKELESESIYVLREVAAQFERSALLFSGGKDSIVLSYLARKAFAPAKIPFPLMHIDTGHNFPETLTYRDEWVKKLEARLIIRKVQDSIDKGRVEEEKGYNASRNLLQTVTLLDAIEELKLDACMGGARRDEEKARAKERFFSHRDEFGQWNPKGQRPELWDLFNGRKNAGEHFRIFPLSNWTELDIWQYIKREGIPIVPLYFAKKYAKFEGRDFASVGAKLNVPDNTARMRVERALDKLRRLLERRGVTSTSITIVRYGVLKPSWSIGSLRPPPKENATLFSRRGSSRNRAMRSTRPEANDDPWRQLAPAPPSSPTRT